MRLGAERAACRKAIRAAAGRLLAGTPLRSASGKLTVTELITKSGLRRDVVYGDYKDLLEEFQARVKAQDSTPGAMRDLAGQGCRFTGTACQSARPRITRGRGRRAGKMVNVMGSRDVSAQQDLFGDGDLGVDAEPVLMALHAEYYELIWQGLKTHEFRRRFLEGRSARWFVYLNGPVSRLMSSSQAC